MRSCNRAAARSCLRDRIARSGRDRGFGEYGRRTRGDKLGHLRKASVGGQKQRDRQTQRRCEHLNFIHRLISPQNFKHSDSTQKTRLDLEKESAETISRRKED